jgi:uncharacterized protein (DUF924 family)
MPVSDLGFLMASTNSDEILTYWFGHIPGRVLSSREQWQIVKRLPVWAGKWGRLLWDVDKEVRERFGESLLDASAGKYDHWVSTPTGRLALILLLDQLSRNMHRDTPDAYAQDVKTLPLAVEALEQGQDKQFYPLARSFFYLPLVHQEELVHQDRAVAAYREAAAEARGLQRAILKAEYLSALRHREAIRRFGRFPHRNDVLGRQSTIAELRFLRQPFSRF